MTPESQPGLMIGERSLLKVRTAWSDVVSGKVPSEAAHVVPGSRQRCDLRRYGRTQDPARIMVRPQEASEKMEVFIGERWSKNKFSTAERSVAGKRIRHFTADDLDAFSKTFLVPVGFFFLPPAKGSFDGEYANSTLSFEYWVGRSIAPHPSEVRATFDELQKRITGDDRKERRQILLDNLLEHTLACVHLLVDIRSSSSRADGIFANVSGQGAKAIEAVLRLGGSGPEDPMADYTRAEWLK